MLAHRIDEAAEAYRRAIDIDDAGGGQAARSSSNLGALYRRMDRLEDSERACLRAVELDPRCGDAWYQLSTTQLRRGSIQQGVNSYCKAVALWPEQQQSRGEVIRALLHLGERERAAHLLGEWLDSEPNNPVAEHMLAACRATIGGSAPPRASDGYVQRVFDAFALSFDSQLAALHYDAPRLVCEALASAAGSPTGAFDVVDVGCGTGLCGPHLRPYARHLAGCDLSEGMLRRAKALGVYDVLHQAELTYYLDAQRDAFDAVVSADTLCYFGPLADALAAARASLRRGGWLVFTVEALPEGADAGHRLQSNGRYAHGRDYLAKAMADAGFDKIALVPVHLRQEGGEPVRGWLVSGCVARQRSCDS